MSGLINTILTADWYVIAIVSFFALSITLNLDSDLENMRQEREED